MSACFLISEQRGETTRICAAPGRVRGADDFHNGKTTAAEYAVPVYGRDKALNQLMKPTDNYPICFPVFGMKMEGKAFLAVIDQGPPKRVIHALPDGKNTSYANAYAHFVLWASDSFVIGEDTGRPQSTNLYQKEPIQIDGVRIGYRFLAGNRRTMWGWHLYREYRSRFTGRPDRPPRRCPSI